MLTEQPPVPAPAPTPVAKQGSGAYIQQLLLQGTYQPEQIIALVHQYFPASKATVKDVAWHRRQLALRQPSAAEPTAKPQPATSLPATAAVAQPNRRIGKTPEKARHFDQTSLSADCHGVTISRDYAAHWFRWGFAHQLIALSNNKHRVLDIGCGVEVPLARVLCGNSNLTLVPELYVGVDLNKLNYSSDWHRRARFHSQFNFVADGLKLKESYPEPFTHAVCFEVIEHMQPEAALILLQHTRQLVADDGVFLLSTPVYDGKAKARNHIHEFTIEELQGLIATAGWTVKQRYGTFANINDLKKVVPPEQLQLLEQLHCFYSWDVLVNFLAPLYPDASRNNVWVLVKSKEAAASSAPQQQQLTLAALLDPEAKDTYDFAVKMGFTVAAKPQLPPVKTRQNFIDHLDEELTELKAAHRQDDLAGIADALVDLVYVAKRLAVTAGLPWTPLWQEVQAANMQKQPGLDDNHKHGVVKPAGWQPPQIQAVLAAHGYHSKDDN